MSNISIIKSDISREYEEAVRKTREKSKINELINFEKKSERPVKVSVIVPVCNVEQYLRECLDSIIAQTLEDIEIICVNDGSTDNGMDILREYAAKDTRVKVIDKENAGYGHAMNIGIDMAVGKYIGIVESDDFVDLHMYEDLYMIAEKNTLDIVKADFNRFYGSSGKYVKDYNKVARNDVNYNRIIDPSEETECFRFIMNTWSGIYNHDFLISHHIRHNETPGASFQDNGFWFKTFAEAKRIMFIDKPYYMNRRDNPNSSVYNPEKIYCGNNEYKYIREYLRSDPKLEEKFLNIFSQKRYHTYLFTLNRIADKFKKEYLHSFAEDFREFEKNGELNRAYFTNKEWETMHWIMRDPDEYYYNEYMKSVKISVILPVYNTGKYLSQCLDSLIDQTFKNFEVICINDGSTDDSYSILYEYSMKDKRIKVYNQENAGAGAARNFGIKAAHGEYFLFLDSDDYYDKNMLKEAYNKALTDDADICIFKSKQYDEQTGKIKDCTFSVRTDVLPTKRPFSLNDMQCNPFTAIMGWAWDKLYKRSFVINNGLLFQEQRTTNDMYFVFASILSAKKITIVEKSLYYQRRNVPTSLSATRERSWQCFYNALLKVRQELLDKGIYEQQKQNFINYALHSCLWNLNTLPEDTAVLLFNKLKNEWFEALDIKDYGEAFYLNKNEYLQFCDIINTVPANTENISYYSYINAKLNYENKQLKSEIDKLKSPARKIKISNNETLSESQLIEKLIWNREQKKILSQKLNDSDLKRLENQNAALEKLLKEAASENERLRNHNISESNYLVEISPKEKLTLSQLKEKLIWNRSEKEKLMAEKKELTYQLEQIRTSFSYKLAMLITWLPRKLRRK